MVDNQEYEFETYNPVFMGFVIHVKIDKLHYVKEQIVNIISKMSFDDMFYICEKNNYSICLNRGAAIAQVSDFKMDNNFILSFYLKKTIDILKEEDSNNKNIIVITDGYNKKMNHGIKMCLNKINFNDINLFFLNLNSNKNEIENDSFKFFNLKENEIFDTFMENFSGRE